MNSNYDIIIIGGGAAGFFTAINIDPIISDTINNTIPVEVNAAIGSLNELSPEIKANIENSQVFYANSYTELVIRAYSYIAMLKFGKATNLNQEILDGNLFFNRANFEIKPLLCLTVNY